LSVWKGRQNEFESAPGGGVRDSCSPTRSSEFPEDAVPRMLEAWRSERSRGIRRPTASPSVHVIATQNPIELEGAGSPPEAQARPVPHCASEGTIRAMSADRPSIDKHGSHASVEEILAG